MSQVWDYNFTGNRKLVMLCLADHCDDNGQSCYPSVPLIAWKTDISTRTVQRILSDLRAENVISIAAEATRYKPNEYHVHLKNATPKEPFRPPIRGDKMSPLTPKSGVTKTTVRGDILSPLDPRSGVTKTTVRGDKNEIRGDKNDRSGVTKTTVRGDTAVSPDPSLDPSLDPSIDPSIDPSSSSVETKLDQPELDDDDDLVIFYRNNISEKVTPHIKGKIADLAIEYSRGDTMDAMIRAADNSAESIAYIETILKNDRNGKQKPKRAFGKSHYEEPASSVLNEYADIIIG